MDEREYLTKEKFEDLTRELEFLKKEKRKEIAEKLEYAKSLGDLSENAEYNEAREMQAIVEDRILKLETVLKNALVVSSHGTDKVEVGSVITVVKEGTEEEKTFTLVGAEESDLSAGKLSVNSPFGKAALGRKKGDKFTFDAPSGPITYKITEIK